MSVRDVVHRRFFTPLSEASRQVGAEVELLAFDSVTNRPLPLLGGPRSLVAMLRSRAASFGWIEVGGYGAVPRFQIPDRGLVSFEPGGQLEISTVACKSASAVATVLRKIVPPLSAALASDGVRLESRGIDPINDVHTIPQQLPVARYEHMTEYFESVGPYGVRMMRQTAAIQLSLDRGPEPADRWRLLNDLAPYVTAIFANSTRYRGVETGHQSYRAHCWRKLDTTRTGIVSVGGDAATEYARFALDARDMMRRGDDGSYRAFGAWPVDDTTDTRWESHLTTLFPEIRPRGHFEVRSCDAIDPAWYAVPIVFLCGLVYDERSARDAAVLAADSRSLLRTAGEYGLRDVAIARTARDLFQLALAGARRLGGRDVAVHDIDVAEQYYADYTAQSRSPANDVHRAERESSAGIIRRLASAPPA